MPDRSTRRPDRDPRPRRARRSSLGSTAARLLASVALALPGAAAIPAVLVARDFGRALCDNCTAADLADEGLPDALGAGVIGLLLTALAVRLVAGGPVRLARFAVATVVAALGCTALLLGWGALVDAISSAWDAAAALSVAVAALALGGALLLALGRWAAR
jgi:hypothetical protein